MAHHSGQDSESIRKMVAALGLGPTGDFPQGRLNQADEGGLRIGVSIEDGKVVVAFGKPTAWVGFDPSQADQLADSIRAKAREIRGTPPGKSLVCTVGLPRSGKTTWARSQPFPIVCPDAIRLALHGKRFIDLAEPFVWATAKVMVRALFGAGHDVVILDATNTTRKRRDEWRSDEWGLYFKDVPTGAITCTARALAEKDEEILPVIERMAGQFEPLADDERQWE